MEDDQLKRGDRRAWEEAYRRYSQYLLCYILSYFLPLEDARDILQATFEILIKRAKDGRLPLVLLPGLLNRQARFLIATHLRDKGQPLRSPFPPLQDPPMKKQTEPVDSDEERILEADLKEKQDRLFEEALQKLPNSQRRVLQLTAQGLSTADIAASLGLREQTVRAQRSEGLQRIRRTIGHSDPFNRD